MVLTVDQKQEIKRLYEEQKFSELIDFINSSTDISSRPAKLFNLLGVAKLLKGKPKKDDLISSIKDFRKGYLNETDNQAKIEVLTNLINTSVELFDIENKLVDLEELVTFYMNTIVNYSTNYAVNNAMSRLFKRLNNTKKIIYHLEKMIETKNFTIGNLCDYAYHRCFENDWKQKEFFDYSAFINKNLTEYSSKDLVNFPNTKNDKIKLAFLSGDISRSHSVTYFLKTVLNNFDKDVFEIILILNQETEDSTTKQFKSFVNRTINIINQEDIVAINEIRKLNLDIIFDLMGLTSTNRINLIRNRVAKKQILWLGYCNTSGVENLDYIMTDRNLIYSNEHNMYSEKVIYLPNIWNCHSGFPGQRKKNNAPIEKKASITFGSFNNFNKINNNVIKTWSKILKSINNSKLLLKSSSNIHSNKRLENEFKKENILDSVEFLPREINFQDHINNYNKIDIALDTFPYNGVTTSFEAIWMGVPVLTMVGYNFNSRCGESINKNLNVTNLIAKNEDDYIATAIHLSNNLKKLLSLREKVYLNSLNSPLFDAKKFNNAFFEIIKNLN